MRAAFSACPAKFRNSYVMKKTSSGPMSVHLVFGGAYASGLEAMRRAFYERGTPLREAKTLGQEAIMSYWVRTGFTSTPEGTPKTLVRCVDAFDSYLKIFNPSEDYLRPVRLQEGLPDAAIEFSFALPIPTLYHPTSGDPLLYTGRFDMLATTNAGALYIVDDKTAGQLGKALTTSMRLKSQFTGYMWACQQYGYNPTGVVIRATQALRTKIEHAELIEQRPPFAIEWWLAQLQRDAARMIAMWETSQWDHSYDEACGSYGGCEFQDACAVEDEITYLNNFYTHRDWDPLALAKDRDAP
jgi:hypothetical protein